MRQLEEDLWTDLTERQEHVLDYVESRIVDGLPPTRQEIGKHFGIYPNAAQGLLKALERKGRIVLMPHISRGIRLVAP